LYSPLMPATSTKVTAAPTRTPATATAGTCESRSRTQLVNLAELTTATASHSPTTRSGRWTSTGRDTSRTVPTWTCSCCTRRTPGSSSGTTTRSRTTRGRRARRTATIPSQAATTARALRRGRPTPSRRTLSGSPSERCACASGAGCELIAGRDGRRAEDLPDLQVRHACRPHPPRHEAVQPGPH
jgi:hypothetical protein